MRDGADNKKEHIDRAGDNGRCKLDKNKIGDDKVDGGEVRDDKVRKKGQKTSKSKKSSKSKKTVGLDFFTLGARLAFIKKRQAFVKALILHQFDPKRHIQIEMDILGYAISGVFSHLILYNLG